MTDYLTESHHGYTVWQKTSAISTLGVVMIAVASYLYLAARDEQALMPTPDEAAMMDVEPFFVTEPWIRDQLLATLDLSLGATSLATTFAGMLNVVEDGDILRTQLEQDGVPIATVFELAVPPDASLADIATSAQSGVANLRLDLLPQAVPDGSFAFLTDDQLINTVLPVEPSTLLLFQSTSDDYPIVERLIRGIVAGAEATDATFKSVQPIR